MMHQENDFWYREDENVQVLGMPYAGDSIHMIVLLPKATDGLPALERELTTAQLVQWASPMHPRKVRVYLPRFKTTSQFELGRTLARLGMPLAFDARDADFSGMSGRPDLYISAVVHKAFVDVNEEGTEAAAATAVVMRAKSAMPAEPPTFRADHPFLFLIRDNESGAILFLGRVANPLK
jgi:serpin B